MFKTEVSLIEESTNTIAYKTKITVTRKTCSEVLLVGEDFQFTIYLFLSHFEFLYGLSS